MCALYTECSWSRCGLGNLNVSMDINIRIIQNLNGILPPLGRIYPGSEMAGETGFPVINCLLITNSLVQCFLDVTRPDHVEQLSPQGLSSNKL